MFKKPSKRQLENEAARHIKRRTYVDRGDASRLTSFTDRGRSVRYIDKRYVDWDDIERRQVNGPHESDEIPEESIATRDHDLSGLEGEFCDKAKADQEQTQTRSAINAFLKKLPELQDLLLEHYTIDGHGTNRCSKCGQARATVQCHDCTQRPPTCTACFLHDHVYSPFHWALVFDEKSGHLHKCTFSASALGGNTLQLGHKDPLALCGYAADILFTVVHCNGVHAIKIRFCQCDNAPSHVAQLMRARLFPGTANEPLTAFTFACMKQFRLFNLQSKCGAFDYILSLRRLTDNVFVDRVPNPYKLLHRAGRIWDLLTLRRRHGAAYGLEFDGNFPSTRASGDLTVPCPTCPMPGLNVAARWPEIPREFAHLRSLVLTLDGNHHACRYTKNTDKSDRSLWNGDGYYPKHEDYMKYLDGVPTKSEKSICNYISAINDQDRKKFRGCDETGIINVQCQHGLVMACTDMFSGERFAYSDFALARALERRSLDDVTLVINYDSACAFCINAENRFKNHLNHLVDTIAGARWTIDRFHLEDHLEACMILFCAIYMIGMGRNTGEVVEQYWSENNQLGPQTRQMNKGYRQDKIMEHHGEWNFKKVARSSRALSLELSRAWRFYVLQRDSFTKLCELHSEDIPKWYHLSREPKRRGSGEIDSVYKHSGSKVPTLGHIHQEMLNALKVTPTENASLTQLGHFLAEGVKMESQQIFLRRLIQRAQDHPLLATAKEIEKQRSELSASIEKWRSLQAVHMELVHATIQKQETSEVEDDPLFLPSHFHTSDRAALNLTQLAAEEGHLREGQACDCILQLRRVVKHISNLHRDRKKNERHQKQQTRARGRIVSHEWTRDALLDTYQACRAALERLGLLGEGTSQRFPPLTAADLFRKSTVNKRSIGDSHRADGELWVVQTGLPIPERTGSNGLSVPADTAGFATLEQPKPPSSSTSMPRRHVPNRTKRTENAPSDPSSESALPRHDSTDSAPAPGTPRSEQSPYDRVNVLSENGRLWSPFMGLPMTDKALAEWEKEEDRVQWHRNWAEMMRWLEEFELKHVEFQRTVTYFLKMAHIWDSVSKSQTKNGYRAFARRQASMYDDLKTVTQAAFHKVGYGPLIGLDGPKFMDAAAAFRQSELSWLAILASPSTEVETSS